MIRNYVLGNQTVFDVLKRELVSPERNITLGGREAEILKLLCTHTNEVISKERMHEQVWGKVFVSDTSLTKAVSNLRKSLAQLESLSCEIKTIPKEGYMLICEDGAIFEYSYEKMPSLNIKQINNKKKTQGQSKFVSGSYVGSLEVKDAVITRWNFLSLFSASLLASLMTGAILLLLR